MKIVTRAEFLKLPIGTVFSKYEPCNFGDLMIKGATIYREGMKDPAHDFYYQSIADSIDCVDFTATMCERKPDQVFDFDFECEGRDGLFERDQLFAVWSTKDVWQLTERLQVAAANAYHGRAE